LKKDFKITTTGLTIPFTGLKKQYNSLRSEILEVTDEVLRSGQLMDGNYTAEFAHWLSRKNGVKHATLCHSGTQALEIIAEYFRSKIGITPPTVVIPALTYPATANAWIRAGWNIHILDTDHNGQMDYKKLSTDLSYQAVCLVGLYGHSVDRQWKNHGDIVIEDAAQHWLADRCRRHSVAAAISFDPTKNFANYGNGGAVVTDRFELNEFARDFVANGKHTKHSDIGTNSRMSEVDCAQMMIKTRHLDAWQHRRGTIARHWAERLKTTSVRTLIDDNNVDKHCYHKFVIDVNNRDILQRNLNLRKIETKIHYSEPLQELPAFQHYQGPDMLAASYSLSRRCLSLPIYPELTDLEVEYIIDQVLDCV
jgi:dTDP-4-amino-4,6-dideoxygalactose transaminase